MHFPNTQRQFSSIGYNIFEYTTVCSIFDVGYRFGFNGKEKDNEINVSGGDYDFGERIYDSRLGRWFKQDFRSVYHPNNSPYMYCANNPIYLIDADGNDYTVSITKDENGKTTLTISSTIYCVGASALMVDEMNRLFGTIYKSGESNGVTIVFKVIF